MVGAEAVFPCHLSPSTDAQHMEIRWFHSNDSGLVHYYRDSQDYLEQQRPEYHGRTELLRENITSGQVALRLHPILPADGGDYRCSFASSTGYREAQFHVIVTASGMAPRIHFEPGPSGNIKLTCMSRGWYPGPEVQWSGPGGLHLEPASETKTVEADGLFRVESSLTLGESSRGHVSCSIRNPVFNEEKEAHVSMAGGLFPRVSTWTVVLALLFSLLAVCMVVTGVVLLRTRKAKEKIIEELERRKFLGIEGLKKARRFAVDVTLDEDTAHPSLYVSPDGKHVHSLSMNQNVPESPGRFTLMPFVLGQNSFSSGCHYWEVKIEGTNRWNIGLCLDSVDRGKAYKGSCPEDGFWTLSLKNGQYKALSMHSYNINVPVAPEVVGIFLQYEDGLISFYDVIELTILFTLKGKFTQPLRPYFYPGPLTVGNTLGLTILKVTNASDSD
ncbi:butyrophilin subfamily 1 member A1-like [Sciurus carolinensis]|uniref:butyrophilin subfamily 1 member A1-like n=1 Tax=Sciurus carolinensis TaxID=30640 RepID=UPI001FB26B22|nr:butyrophilin subfamily 1 member A1-like [Sciurus carolinensis]